MKSFTMHEEKTYDSSMLEKYNIKFVNFQKKIYTSHRLLFLTLKRMIFKILDEQKYS